MYAKFRCAPLRIKKDFGIFGPSENCCQEQEEEEQLEWLSGSRLPGPKMCISVEGTAVILGLKIPSDYGSNDETYGRHFFGHAVCEPNTEQWNMQSIVIIA